MRVNVTAAAEPKSARDRIEKPPEESDVMTTRTIARDGEWENFRGASYREALRATAWIWATILRAGEVHDLDTKAHEEVYKRAVLMLPHSPFEWGSGDYRFERCRWRADVVETGRPTPVHCEHPWTKARTKRIVEGLHQHGRAAPIDRLLEAISLVLDARQDTVLLPTQRVTTLGVVSEARGDGLLRRYGPAIKRGQLRLIDRRDGTAMSFEQVEQVEQDREAQVARAWQILGVKTPPVIDIPRAERRRIRRATATKRTSSPSS